MKRIPKILAASLAAVALSASFALAAEPAKTDVPPAPAYGHGPHGRGAGPMGPHAGMMGPLSQLSPEKQAAALKLMDGHRKALFPLHQSLYAKRMELEALNAAGDGEGGKAKAVIRDIADLNAKMLTEDAKMRARLFKETGLRTPVMGHGPMGPHGGMGHGMMGGGMGGGKGMCGGMMGGMGPGLAPVPAPDAPPAPPAAPAHDAHQ